MTGAVVGEDNIGQNVIDFVEGQTGEAIEIISVEKQDSFYSSLDSTFSDSKQSHVGLSQT